MGDFHSYQVPAQVTGPTAPDKPASETPATTPAATPAATAAERPAHIPEKFWKDGKVDVDGLVKSYGELEKRNSQVKPVETTVKPASTTPAETKKEETPSETKKEETPNTQDTTQSSEIPGVNKGQAERFTQEFQKDGKLSEESYADLQKAGYSKSVVDAYIKGLAADQTAAVSQANEIKGLAGGEKGYSQMAEWMQANLTPDELSDYNDAVSSQRSGIIKTAVTAMHAKYQEAVGGNTPKLISGQGNNTPAGDTFASRAEITAAIRDVRYKKDEGYRQAVQAKIQRSSI